MKKIINTANKREKLSINILNSNQVTERGRRNMDSLFNCKVFCLALILMLMMISQTKFVSANFVCGQVLDSEDNISASWFNVRVFYSYYRENFTSCQISPAENKYCCDTEAIPGKGRIGDEVAGEIFDNESGYAAGPVSVITSGEGYSIFPEMRLEKAIKISNPDSKLVFSNTSEIFLNLSFKEPYNFVEMEKEGNKSVLCLNCSRIEQNINSEFGMNYLKIIASYGSRMFSEDIVFALLKSYGFERKIECKGCKENIVKGLQTVNMSISVNLSNYVEGLELKEYVPVSWQILNTDGEIKEYGETHNLIVWNVSGKDIIKQYIVKTPKIGFFPTGYTFRTELEQEVLREDKIIVSRFFKFFAFNEKIALKRVERKSKYSIIRPNMPFVKRFDNETVLRIAVFPKKIIKNAEFNLEPCTSEKTAKDMTNCYLFSTNFNEEIEKIFIEFKIKKEFFKNYENASLLVLNEWGEWRESGEEIERYGEDENYVYYREFIEPCKGVAFAGKNKKSFFSSLAGLFS